MLYPEITSYFDQLRQSFDLIPAERKVLLEKISTYIAQKRERQEDLNLVYICTHNSRRSHFGQVWARIAADYYAVPKIFTFSGGTEATAFHPNAIAALRSTGLKVQQVTSDNTNPHYEVRHGDMASPSLCFSKTYDHPANPQKDFAAIMTCSDAEENCPFIPGVDLRIATTYDDPKVFDGSNIQEQKYDERCRQIAMETLYVFSKL